MMWKAGMRMKVEKETGKVDRNREGHTLLWGLKRGEILANLSGILLAFGIAFGGLFWVKGRLAQEEARVLQESGMVRIIGSDNAVEGEENSAGEAGRAKLTEEELLQAVQNLENRAESCPHEPSQGQLSMAEAIACARTWMEEFCMPRLGMSEFSLQESKANCYLWTSQEDVGDTAGNRQASYWTVALSAQGMEAEILLHAISGQVLDASVSFPFSAAYQDRDMWSAFLKDYADSFGLEREEIVDGNGVPEEDGRVMYQSVGSKGLLAVLKPERIVFSRLDAGSGVVGHMEICNMRIYLTEK